MSTRKMSTSQLVLIFALCASVSAADTKLDDLVTSLPGLTFNVTFAQYSGYLDATLGNRLHYWLLEAQANPSRAPLVLWLNGGPGCSSLEGLFSEHGPYRPSKDGKNLIENVFAWNKVANIIYLESPRDVGFSYRQKGTYGNDTVYNDDKTAIDAAIALRNFFTRFPEYKFRDFYVTGESYGGVYVPTLTRLLIQMINNGTQPYMRLKGFVVGNGEMSEIDQINSAINLMFSRSLIGKAEFDSLYACCARLSPTTPFAYCKFTDMITLDQFGNAIARDYGTDTQMQICANNVVDYGYNYVWLTANEDVYNSYQDCYTDGPSSSSVARKIIKSSRFLKQFSNGEDPFVDYASLTNKASTDAIGSFPCYMNDAMPAYLNLPEVRAALHIPDFVQPWEGCSTPINEQLYEQQHHDMSDVFDDIFSSGFPLRVLIYNGDADMACNFLGDQWFIERLSDRQQFSVDYPRQPWFYYRNQNYLPRIGGFAKRFSKGEQTLDLLTVKGAGHFVPQDRPGPAFQMFINYLFAKTNYSDIVDTGIVAQPLLDQFQPQVGINQTRKEADEIFELPGATFSFSFKQYAGYLNGIPGNNLYYWFLESQANPTNDPLVLWLAGGPGCSSLESLLREHGPFHPNRDGTTLYENVYSYNKVANVIYLESPRNVGFSFQDKSVNPDTNYSDDKSVIDHYLAILDFLSVFPEYKNRPFYIATSSYGGIYGPQLVSYLVDRITSGELTTLNLQGIAIGNGLLNSKNNVNSILHVLYFHGIFGKEEWDQLQACCPYVAGNPPDYFERCDFAQYVRFDDQGNIFSLNGTCGNLVVALAQDRVYNGGLNPYFNYNDCYNTDADGNVLHTYPTGPLNYPQKGFVDQARLYSRESTDNQDGFVCWSEDAVVRYLNKKDVQKALHVFDNITTWVPCSADVGNNYTQQYFDMQPFFDNIIAKKYPLRTLIYNGDLDFVCNFIQDQWFVEDLAAKYSMALSQHRDRWIYEDSIGGYAQQFTYETGTIYLVTVKGGGHMTSLNRPGPSLQLFSNFISNKPYSAQLAYQTDLSPLKDGYDRAEQASASISRSKRSALDDSRPDPPPAGSKEADRVTNLPGLSFNFAPAVYSGYLNLENGNYLHYILVEAETNPAGAPLIMWLNGGPGCSSLNGFLTENGPFLNNLDGETLFENVYSWHKIGNVLYLESPRDVGFSYRANNVDPDDVYSDTKTAVDNVQALKKFLVRFTEYQGRQFFLTGESYGGIYVPTFTDLLIQSIQANEININLVGIGIGNGIMSAIQQTNSLISLNYYKGLTSREDFDQLKACVVNWTQPMTYFDWVNTYAVFDAHFDLVPKNSDPNSFEYKCAKLIDRLGSDSSGNDGYNTYQDCYSSHPKPIFPGGPSEAKKARKSILNRKSKTANERKAGIPRRSKRDVSPERILKPEPYIDEAKRMNYFSTDSNGGFYCGDGMDPWLNKQNVQQALHIPPSFFERRVFESCSSYMDDWVFEYPDTISVFQNIFASGYPLRILFYNGDADMVCQYLGDQWFAEQIAQIHNMQAGTRNPWTFAYSELNKPVVAGYVKSFNYVNQAQTITLDVLTIKGAGHLVPIDRPGPILQAISNFVNARDYSTPAGYNIALTPLLPQYQPQAPQVSQRDANRVFNLPGLTFPVNFAMYSGYLSASTGNSLFYWLLESQGSPSTDPIILWLTGGPGCSSMGALLEENGPFHANPDGKTLFENVYAWNKIANVLYVDSPRQVGFAYQNPNTNHDGTFNDDKTIADLGLALTSFFSIHTEYVGRDFYVTGESYGGVYIPTLSRLLVNEITSGTRTLNFKGFAIGNGCVSEVHSLRADPAFTYFHGLLDKSDYDAMIGCCPNPETSMGSYYCNFDQYFQDDNQDPCQNTLYDIFDKAVVDDYYNMFQDCYLQTELSFGSRRQQRDSKYFMSPMRRKMREFMEKRANSTGLHKRNKRSTDNNYGQDSIYSQLQYFDPISTDQTGGFQCYMDGASASYMSQANLRSALHIPDYVQDWQFCNDDVNYFYDRQYDDTTPFFQEMLDSGLPLKILIYNGDIDTACTSKTGQYFVEEFAATNNFQQTPTTLWQHRQTNAGSLKSFTSPSGTFTIDLVTVKGSGHFAPTDRPGPVLQLLTNYLRNTPYNNSIPFSIERRELFPQFQPKLRPIGPVNSGSTSSPIVPPPITPPTDNSTSTAQSDGTTTSGTTGTTSSGTAGTGTSTQSNGESSSTTSTPVPTTSTGASTILSTMAMAFIALVAYGIF